MGTSSIEGHNKTEKAFSSIGCAINYNYYRFIATCYRFWHCECKNFTLLWQDDDNFVLMRQPLAVYKVIYIYYDDMWWAIFMEQKLIFGLVLGRLAVLMKEIWVKFDQLLRAVFPCFYRQNFLLKNILASALKSCIKWRWKNLDFFFKE